jgi:hypothetical protein
VFQSEQCFNLNKVKERKMVMAKNVVDQALVLAFGLVCWLKPKNKRTVYGDTTAIRDSLAERGWFENNVVPVTPIQHDSDLTASEREVGKKSEFALCMEERKVRWDAYKKAASEGDDKEKKAQLAVFEALYVKGGKLVEPKYCGNAGFRRASVFEEAMLIRYKDETIAELDKILDQVPVRVKHYASEAERIIDQQLENELQGVGQVKIPDLDKLRIAQELFSLGVREVHLRKLYTDTTGQKLFGICQANHNWPGLTVYGRMLLPENDSNYIPYGPVRHNVLIKFNNRYEADEKRRQGKPLKPSERSLAPITQEDVASYFNECKTGNPAANAQKIMAKKDIEGIAKQNSIGFVRLVMQSVLDDTNRGIADYMPHADQLNLHKELIDSGKAETANVALTLAKEYPDVLATVNTALETLSKDELVAVVNATVNDKRSAQTVNVNS